VLSREGSSFCPVLIDPVLDETTCCGYIFGIIAASSRIIAERMDGTHAEC
jgi:hypothetical protein